MPRLDSRIIACGVAGGCFAISVAGILTTRPMFIARATAELSKTEASAEGLAAFERIEFGSTNRMMPNEAAARLRSAGSIRRALQIQKLPDDDRTVADAASRVATRLVAGTTLIEAIVRADTADGARGLAGALFDAHEALRRERRREYVGALVGSLDAAMAALRDESQSVSEKLAAMDVHTPTGGRRFNMELETAMVDVAAQRAGLKATLQRLEAIVPDDAAAMAREIDDASRGALAQDEGYAQLRADLSARLGELAQLRSQFGENSPRVQSAKAELATLRDSLRGYLAGQIARVRSQLAAMESAGAAIDARAAAKVERARAVQVALVSPDAEAQLLRREAIRVQLRHMEMRRRELLVYAEVYEPALVVLDPPHASDSPEIAHRSARLVLAAFGALLVGFSLSIMLDRRSAAVI